MIWKNLKVTQKIWFNLKDYCTNSYFYLIFSLKMYFGDQMLTKDALPRPDAHQRRTPETRCSPKLHSRDQMLTKATLPRPNGTSISDQLNHRSSIKWHIDQWSTESSISEQLNHRSSIKWHIDRQSNGTSISDQLNHRSSIKWHIGQTWKII